MGFPSKIDIEYLIDAAQKSNINKFYYIAYRLYLAALEALDEHVHLEYYEELKSLIPKAVSRIREEGHPELPDEFRGKTTIQILVKKLEDKYAKPKKTTTTSKALRTAIKALSRISQEHIPEEFLLDTEYDEGGSNEANMDVPISRIDIEYLIDAARKTYTDEAAYISYSLYNEARETLEMFKICQTLFLGPAENTEDLESLIRKGLLSFSKGTILSRPNGYAGKTTIEKLVLFCSTYNVLCQLLQEEDEKHKKWGILSEDFQQLEGRSAMRERIITTSKALRTALKMLTRVERGDTPEEDFIQENEIPEEFLQDTEYDEEGSNKTFNIIPFDSPTHWLPDEVKKAIASLKWGIEAFPFSTGDQRDVLNCDILDCLQDFFKFQESSVSNQRENIVNLLSNALIRTPGEPETAFDTALVGVFNKSLGNYKEWCSYLRTAPIWKNTDVRDLSKEKKILYISLYYLIWGEAANVRFLPECLCYIFHRMSEQLDKVLNGTASLIEPRYEGSFIKEVIQPLYEVIAAEAKINNKRDTSHSKWRNYDDFNEYFWSRDCLKLTWPLGGDSRFFQKPPEGSTTTLYGKTSFVERRTFIHLYHSFHRMWIFHVLMFEALVILAFNDGKFNPKLLRETLPLTYFLMKFFQSMIDIWLKYGAYYNTSFVDVSLILFRFIWFMLATLIICFPRMKCLQEKTSSIEESIGFKNYITVLGIYAISKILFSKLSQFLSTRYENSLVARFINWINQEEYVGRGMGEKCTDIFWYVLFWLGTLGFNFAYTYYRLISPLVRPTRDIIDVSKNIHHMLAIGSLWAGVICAYIVGSHILYNVISAVVGTVLGYRDGLGKIKFLGDVHKCFDDIPKAFMDHLNIRESLSENNQEDVKKNRKLDATEFSPFWNQIVMNLREEDYISDLEEYALSMPEKSGGIDVIQWPPFLLVGKVSLATKIAAEDISQERMWDKISSDVYMRYAVEECFHSVKFILSSVLDYEGSVWVKGIYKDIQQSIADRNLSSKFKLDKLASIIEKISELIEILYQESRLPEPTETMDQMIRRCKARRPLKNKAKNAQGLTNKAKNAAKNLYEVIQSDFLRVNTRKQFSDFNWPTDHPELRSQIKRLHSLLTMKSADHVPRNREARRRLEFFTNSLFMSMPITKPVSEMLSFSVLTPYYEEIVLYTIRELLLSNDDGVTLIDYLKNLYPDEWINYCERLKYRDIDNTKEERLEMRLWASYRGQTLARTVRGTMYYQKALLLQAYREMLTKEGLGVDGLPSNSPVDETSISGSVVSMDQGTQDMLDSLEESSSRGELLLETFDIMLHDEEDYNPWRVQMMVMLESGNMTCFINGSLEDPDPKAESQDENVWNYSQKWKELDKEVKEWIMASLNPLLKNMVDEMKTAKELWETLKMFFSTDIISSVNVTNVSKLCNKDDYCDWVSEMEKFLQAKGMFCFINGKFEDPAPDEESQEVLVRTYSERWKKLDKQVMNWITDSLHESMRDSVKEIKTAEQMWDALKEIIGSQGLNKCLDKAKAHVDLKFTYVVTCQKYGEQKRGGEKLAADIAFLLKRNEGLRVAFVDKNDKNEFYSKLVKADKNGKEKEVYSIKLPGDPILGEGKPENQNHAIVFTRGNAIQTIDMNQDNYFEETLKMRNLLEEFHREPAPTILGIREHIFTGSASSLASFMSNQETGFVTLGQRVIAKPLKVRMHYGHPDVFDRVFHITRGGISKASPGINLSEDIYAGFNSTLRKGSVTHHEYIQVGKGRDVGFNQIAIFEGKVAGGNGEQVLSRDMYRLGQQFDFFRMHSLYYSTVGYYFSSLLTVITLYILLYGNLIMALSGTKVPHKLNDTDMIPELLLMIVLLPASYIVCVLILEQGFEKAVESFLTMFSRLCSIFFAFSLGTRIHRFGRSIMHGGASYQATDRGFVLDHIKFSENYRLFSRSHFVKGIEVLFLVLVYIIYGFHSFRAIYNNLLLLGGSILSISWIVAPFLFNSSAFNLKKNLEDWQDWNNWLNLKSNEVDQRKTTKEQVKESWEVWWDTELAHIRTFEGRVIETILCLRFFIFMYVVISKICVQGSIKSLLICGLFWILFVVILLAYKVLSKKNLRVLAIIVVLATAFFTSAYVHDSMFYNECYTVNVGDILAFIIAFITTLWGILSICVAWKPKLVMGFAKICDAGMGTLMFSIASMLSRRSIKQYLLRNMFDHNVSEYLQKSSAETASLYGRGF